MLPPWFSRLAAYTRLYPPPRQQQRAIAHHRPSSYLTGHPVLVGFLVCPSPVQTQRRHTTTSLSTTTRLLHIRFNRTGGCYIRLRCTGLDSGRSGMLGLPDSGFSVCSSVSVKTPTQPTYAPNPPFTDTGTATLVSRVSAFALGSDFDRRPCHRHRILVQVTCLTPNTHHEIPLPRNTLRTHFAAIGYRPFDGLPSRPHRHHGGSGRRLCRGHCHWARVSSADAPGASHRCRKRCATLGSALCHRVWEPLYLPA